MPIRVLLADDHSVVRKGLRGFLELDDDFEVVGEAANGEEAVRLAREEPWRRERVLENARRLHAAISVRHPLPPPGAAILPLTLGDELFQQAPEAFEAVADTIFSGLDNDTMAELNRRVSAEGEDPKAVATDYLTEKGVL